MSSGIADAGVLLSRVSCIDRVFLRVLLGYTVFADNAGDLGSDVVGLAGHPSPTGWSSASFDFNTSISLSVISMSSWLANFNAVMTCS